MTMKIFLTAVSAILISSGIFAAEDPGFFRTIPSENPDRGVVRVSNTTFHSGINVNGVLKDTYGVQDTKIFSSITEFDLGVTNHLSFNGSLPYYADTFKQGGKGGSKTGAGDVVLGLRLSKKFDNTALRSVSIGTRFRVAEQLGYGPEPLGFRTFSYGKPAYSIDMASGFKINRLLCGLSVSMIKFPGASSPDSIFAGDTFYDTGMGYLGIGSQDASGLAKGIFENQIHISLGAALPVKPWFSGLVELNSTIFRKKLESSQAVLAIQKPEKGYRTDITTLAYGIRLGKAEGFNMSLGVDYALNLNGNKNKDLNPVDDNTFMMRVRIPTLSAGEIKRLLARKKTGDEMRARNSFVAVGDFKKNDLTYLYEKDLKNTLFAKLVTAGLFEMAPQERVKEVFDRGGLTPIPEKPGDIGVKLGADYIIQASIENYKVERTSSLTIPYLISLPCYKFRISAAASVTNLLTGETEQLGTITAEISKPRSMELFPTGESSFFDFISEPERREAERELINQWVEEFDIVMMDKINILGWEPRKTALKGEEEKG